MDGLEEEIASIVLRAGDIIVDHAAGYVGILLRRDRRIDIEHDDVYFWEIRWSAAFRKSKERKRTKKELNIMGYLEEETLKLSILVGTTEKYSSDDP